MTYQHMAPFYDYFMRNAPYGKWIDFTKEIFNQYGENINKIIDLGCGTGEITIRLAKKGYHLFGIDYSSEMLSYAEQKAFKENVPIQWVHQDARKLDGFSNMDAVISFCDVMNYITTEKDLRIVFERVYTSLKDDGLFIFDIHSLNYVQNTLMNETFAEVTDEISYIWNCISGEELGEMHHQLTFFNLDGDKYVRFDEDHYQRTYPIPFYKGLLTDTGFTKINIYKDFSLENESSFKNANRIFFLAMK